MPLDEPANSDTKIIINAMAIPVLIPAIIKGNEAGRMTLNHFLNDDFVSVEAAC